MPISEAQDALGIKDDRPSQEGNSEGTEMVRESPLRRAFCCLEQSKTPEHSGPHNRHHLLDQPLQRRILLPLGDADDIQLEGAEIERQVEQLQRQ